MHFPAGFLISALLALLFASPPHAAGQRAVSAHDWQRLQLQALHHVREPSALPDSRHGDDAPLQSPQRIRYGSPTPYVIGGSAVGAFAGGVIGYASCVAGDGDCSVLVRLAAGTGIGAFLGAVFWLASAVER